MNAVPLLPINMVRTLRGRERKKEPKQKCARPSCTVCRLSELEEKNFDACVPMYVTWDPRPSTGGMHHIKPSACCCLLFPSICLQRNKSSCPAASQRDPSLSLSFSASKSTRATHQDPLAGSRNSSCRLFLWRRGSSFWDSTFGFNSCILAPWSWP